MYYKHVFLFTGHMIDPPTRKEQRFPAEMEPLVASAIDEAVGKLAGPDAQQTFAISGAARGGDLLFLEACQNRAIDRQMVIGRSFETFLENFARNIPGNWPDRASRIWNHTGTRQDICVAPADAHRYQYVNDHMLATALDLGDTVTLIALWDGVNRGKGGPSDFLERARDKAALHVIPFSDLADRHRADQHRAG